MENINKTEVLVQQKIVKIVAISDLHSKFRKKLPPADILIVAGDITMNGQFTQLKYFMNWLDQLQDIQYKIVIAGNHDICLDAKNYKRFRSRLDEAITKPQENKNQLKKHCIYLQNQSVNVLGLMIYGSPNTPKYYQWAFNYQVQQARDIWNNVPQRTDILVTHGPAKYINDQTTKGHNAGCPQLKRCLKKIKPKIHICGHIHQSFGFTDYEGIKCYNVSYLKRNYKARSVPITQIQLKVINNI